MFKSFSTSYRRNSRRSGWCRSIFRCGNIYSAASAIIVRNIIYAFAGEGDEITRLFNKYQYALVFSNSPSTTPSTAPSTSPTASPSHGPLLHRLFLHLQLRLVIQHLLLNIIRQCQYLIKLQIYPQLIWIT